MKPRVSVMSFHNWELQWSGDRSQPTTELPLPASLHPTLQLCHMLSTAHKCRKGQRKWFDTIFFSASRCAERELRLRNSHKDIQTNRTHIEKFSNVVWLLGYVVL
jgi:hypothetical protein